MNSINAIFKTALTAGLIVLAGLTAAPANAQNIREVLNIGRILGVTNSYCGYGSNIDTAACLVRDRAERQRSSERRRRDEASQVRNQAEGLMNARAELMNACRAGDQWSCRRVATIDTQVNTRSLTVIRALDSACRAGDTESCKRLAR